VILCLHLFLGFLIATSKALEDSIEIENALLLESTNLTGSASLFVDGYSIEVVDELEGKYWFC